MSYWKVSEVSSGRLVKADRLKRVQFQRSATEISTQPLTETHIKGSLTSLGNISELFILEKVTHDGVAFIFSLTYTFPTIAVQIDNLTTILKIK